MVKLGTTEAQRKLFFKLRQEQERLLTQGFEATPKLLAERLNVTEQDVVEMDQRLGHDEVSIDAPVGDDGDDDPRRPPPAVDAAARGRRAAGQRGAQAALPRASSPSSPRRWKDKERYIFEKRLTADEPMTLQDIGDPLRRQPRAGAADRGGADRPDARVHARGDPGLRPRRRAGALRPDRYSGRIVRLSKCTFDSHPESAK